MRTIRSVLSYLKRKQGTKFYQVHVASEVVHDFKKNYHYSQLNEKGERCYKKITLRVIGILKNMDPETRVLRVIEEKAEYISVGWNGPTGKGTYPIYIMYVEKIDKKNVATTRKIKEELIPYTKEELKGRRFTL